MDNIAFTVFPELRLLTFTRGETALPNGASIQSLTVTVKKNHPLILRTADEIPFFFYAPKAHLIGATPLTFDDTLAETLLKDLPDFLAKFNVHPEDLVCYFGPSLTFAHVPVERDVLLSVMAHGYRAAAKRTFGVDYLDLPIMNFLMLRRMGVAANNIYLDAHDTYECSELLYSASRRDKRKNLSLIELLA